MAKSQKYEKLSSQERQNRYFNENLKRKKFREIERNISRYKIQNNNITQ